MPAHNTLSLLDLPLTDELIEGLLRLYPPRCPDIQDTERAIFFYAGQHALVMQLKYALDVQKNQRERDHDRRKSIQALNHLAGCS